MPERLIFLSILLLTSFASPAQRNEREQTAIQWSDTTRILDLVRQSYDLRETQPYVAIDRCITAASMARRLKYRKGEGRALGSVGWIYYRKGDFVSALEMSFEALKISRETGDKEEEARCMNNIGILYFDQKQFDQATYQFRNALSLSREINDKHLEVRSLNNIASMHELTKQYDSAKAYATQALEISSKTGDDYFNAISNYTLGDIYSAQGEYDLALEKYKRSLTLSHSLSSDLKLEVWYQIANVYIHQNKVEEAMVILNKNIDIAKKNGYREQLSKAYQLLSVACKINHNFAAALDYQERYAVLHDSIFNDENSKRLAIIQSQSDVDKKQVQIELLTKDTLLNKEVISKQRTQLYTTIGGLIGILLLAGVLILGYFKIKHTNVLLKHRTSQLASLNATKDKLFSIISHDFRSPLNSLRGMLALVENKNLTQEEFVAMSEKLRKNFNAVSDDLENLLQWSVTQLQGIQTNSSRINIQPIVAEHIIVFHEIAKAKNVQLESMIPGPLFAIADEDHIRLVLRNLINNAIKFTPSGGIVKISSQEDIPFIKIRVADTGVGMESEQMETLFLKTRSISTIGTNKEKGVGLGLLLCHEFIENNGGQLDVQSEPGKGSVFSFTLRAA